MKTSPWTLFLAAIAAISGGVVLLGYFLPLPGLADLRDLLLDWTVILTAIALLVGVANLAGVHWRRIAAGGSGMVYSAVTLVALGLTLLVSLAAGPASPWSVWLYNHLLVPIEGSLMAVLAVTLILAFARMFGRKLTLPALVFALAALFALASAFAWPGMEIFGLSALRAWVINVWAVAGARGILLGVALGAIAAGLRVLIGVDRPYSR